MRRTDLIEAVNEILDAISAADLRRVIKGSATEKGDKAWGFRLVESLKNYTITASRFSPAARELIKILEISYFEETATWAAALLADSPRARNVMVRISYDINFIYDYLPKVMNILKPASLTWVNDEGLSTKYRDKDVISIIIIEDDNRLSSPERLIEVLESVSTLYKACAHINGVPPEGLSVISCDSGSDKSFDFLGAAKVIECLKELILSLWDRIVFYREKQLEQRIELVNKSLPIYERLGELVKEKRLEPEMAEILRRDVFESTGKFIKAGATIPEVKNVSHHEPRVLMAPEPKLLVSAPEGAAEGTSPPQNEDVGAEVEAHAETEEGMQLNFNNLGDEERAALIRLLEKARRADSPNSPEGDDDAEESPDAL